MKATCALSGIEFTTSGLHNIRIDKRSLLHPVMYLERKHLSTLLYSTLERIDSCEPQEEESLGNDMLLLVVALLHSTKLLEFRSSVVPCTVSRKAALVHGSAVALLAARLEVMRSDAEIPTAVVTHETADLNNLEHLLDVWNHAITSADSGTRSLTASQAIYEAEVKAEQAIRNSYTASNPNYGQKLAAWASLCGNFPQFQTSTPFGVMTIAEYWRRIIASCASGKQLFNVPAKDIQELIDHVTDNIPAGSLCFHQVMKLISSELREQQNLIGTTDFVLLLDDSNTSLEAANLQLLIRNAPTAEPRRGDYPTASAYVLARIKWQTAKLATQATQAQPDQINLEDI